MRRATTFAMAACIGLTISHAAAAETIKIGFVPTTGTGPLFIAFDRGYFAAEGLTPELVPFDAAQIVTQAAMAGDIDIGSTAASAALYNLAAKGGLKIVGGLGREVPGFQGTGYIASNRAWDAGLHSLKDLNNRTVAIPQMGGPLHYEVSLAAAKYHLDMKTMRLLPLQTVPNVATAVIGGQPDVGLMPNILSLQLVNRKQGHLLAWVGDETPWQISVLFVATKTADQREKMIEAFLRAFRHGAHDYRDAFTDADGKRKDGPTAPAVLAILAQHLHQPAAELDNGIGFDDPDAKLDMADIPRQVDWYKSQAMVPADAKGTDFIDMRYVVPLK